MNRIFFIITILVFSFVAVCGDVAEDARALISDGKFAEAKELLENKIGNAGKNNTTCIYLLGVCEYELGNTHLAKDHLETAKSKGNGLANLYLGKIAFLAYDFDGASDYYEAYKTYRKKNKQPDGEEAALAEEQLNVAENALDRVERIVVIDSIALPKSTFFSSYKLPESAGSLTAKPVNSGGDSGKVSSIAFLSEAGDYMIWAESNPEGGSHLVESELMIDEGWQKPVALPDELNVGQNADYPFLMGDGSTLYYAADGPESIGGLDIFIAKRDPLTGEYLQPTNLGMPFNSPFDDYMLAIDEENGIGWWATDRNRLGDKVTVYVYIVNDIRKNYDSDDDNLVNYARLTDYQTTQDGTPKDLIREKKKAIREISRTDKEESHDFEFKLPDGSTLTNFDQLRKQSSVADMKALLAAQKEISDMESRLRGLRRQYAAGRANNVKEEIIKLENTLERKLREERQLKNKIYKAEK